MPASDRPVAPRSTSTGLPIHAAAMAAKTARVVRSPRLIGPSAALSNAMCSSIPAIRSRPMGNSTRVNSSRAIGRETATSGTPISIQRTKLISMPRSLVTKEARKRLGGVPISVPMPPMLAA